MNILASSLCKSVTLSLIVAFTALSIVTAQPVNDDFASATDITGLINSCSTDGAYSTIVATADGNASTCGSNPLPLANVWFKFTAPATASVNATIEVGGSKGTQRRTLATLWETDGTTEIACKRYIYNHENVVVGAQNLVPGNTYYLSVDVFSYGYAGTFTLCLDDVLDYDFFEGALDVSELINTCSPDGAYTTIGASPDKNAGSCHLAGPHLNRWFKFTAPQSGSINATVKVGGPKGSQRRTQAALWEADGTTEIVCKRYNYNHENVVVGAQYLVPGNTYYLSVDVFNSGYDGTFTLCLDDALDYDFYEGANDITGLINSCSLDGAYTTTGASPDKTAGTCHVNEGPQLNRWFKFTAPQTGAINATVKIGGSKGTQRRTQAALWEAGGTTEIACKRFTYNNEDVIVGAQNLVPGNTYYLSVDVFSSGYDGTFTLCLSDGLDYDFYEGAKDITGLINSCSLDGAYTTTGASPDKNAGTCHVNGGPILNRWFKFTAPQTGAINATVKIGGSKGTQRRTQAAIWEADGTTEIYCKKYTYNDEDVTVGAQGLVPGNTYYCRSTFLVMAM